MTGKRGARELGISHTNQASLIADHEEVKALAAPVHPSGAVGYDK